MGELRQLQPVEIPDEAPAETLSTRAAASMISLGLKTLSQRALAATRDVFTLLSVGTIFWVWNEHPDPTVLQIISLSLYATFILAANVIVRRV
jgi:hypothetical protein